MDAAGSVKSSSSQSPWCAHEEQFFGRRKQNLDRFIPNRAALDLDYAGYMLRRGEEVVPKSAYQKLLADTLNMNRGRIFTFKDKPPTKVEAIPSYLLSPPSPKAKSTKPQRYINNFSERTLDAPDFLDDFNLNLLDWSINNVLAIAVGNTVYLWSGSLASIVELVTIDDEDGPVTSISWAPDGQHIAVGLENSCVQYWDSISIKLVRTLRGGHQERVGSLAWNKRILTTGGRDGRIINNDVRARTHIVGTHMGHQEEVCGLKWSPSGQHLASGGNDGVLFIWDRSTAAPNSPRQWLHKLIEDHTSAVKALAWCPFQDNLLATGGGRLGRCIKFWNTQAGTCWNSVDTGSQVCGLLWNKNERELLSSQGSSKNELILWKYPSMVRMAELTGHASKVLGMSQSPNGTVATAAADETVQIWNVFRSPGVSKPVRKENPLPFTDSRIIR